MMTLVEHSAKNIILPVKHGQIDNGYYDTAKD